jgi:two-component system, NarL family, response regulator NreC
MSISVLLADAHPFVRQGMRTLIQAIDDIYVAGEAASGQEALELVASRRPDVMVLDLRLPDMTGMKVLSEVQQRFPRVRVVILSTHGEDVLVQQALRNGAMGYVLKDADVSELILAVRSAAAGKRFLSRELAARAFEAYARHANREFAPLAELTRREREVLQLAAQGFDNSEIGVRLAISPLTASSHRARILRKLDETRQTGELGRAEPDHSPLAH